MYTLSLKAYVLDSQSLGPATNSAVQREKAIAGRRRRRFRLVGCGDQQRDRFGTLESRGRVAPINLLTAPLIYRLYEFAAVVFG